MGDPADANPSPTTSLMEPPEAVTAVLGEGAKFSLTPFQLLRGGLQPLRPPLFGCCGSLMISVLLGFFLVGKQLLFLVVIWRGESPEGAHATLLLTSV